MSEHPIENVMKTTMENLKEMIDVNTIVGDAVETAEGTVIVPISKVSFGFIAGGGEYKEEGASKKAFGNGSGNSNGSADGEAKGVLNATVIFRNFDTLNLGIMIHSLNFIFVYLLHILYGDIATVYGYGQTCYIC